MQVPPRKSGFQRRLFSFKNDVQLGELMKHSDVVTNLALTISVDTGLLDTPIIRISFDYFDQRELSYSVQKFYQFDHYAKLVKTRGVMLADSLDDLINKIARQFASPNHLAKKRLDIVKHQCMYTNGKWGTRIASFIVNVIK